MQAARILVVDDDPNTRETLADQLTKLGHRGFLEAAVEIEPVASCETGVMPERVLLTKKSIEGDRVL